MQVPLTNLGKEIHLLSLSHLLDNARETGSHIIVDLVLVVSTIREQIRNFSLIQNRRNIFQDFLTEYLSVIKQKDGFNVLRTTVSQYFHQIFKPVLSIIIKL
jgi:hypothetical protein